MNYKHPVSVLVVIHSPTLDVLLLERAAHPGLWQSVTGSQERGETLVEAARRELCEETGIIACPGQIQRWPLANRFEIYPLWRERYAPGVTHNMEHVFSICVPSPTVIHLAPGEHRAYRWLPWREAAAECFSWTNQDAVLMLPLRWQHQAHATMATIADQPASDG